MRLYPHICRQLEKKKDSFKLSHQLIVLETGDGLLSTENDVYFPINFKTFKIGAVYLLTITHILIFQMATTFDMILEFLDQGSLSKDMSSAFLFKSP